MNDSTTDSICGVDVLARVHFEGADAARFLQGYLTCNTAQLAPDHWQAGAFCDLKGRVIANGWVMPVEGGIDLVLHRELAANLLEFLRIYLRFSKTRTRIDEATAMDIHFPREGTAPLRIITSSVTPPAATNTALMETLNQRRFVLVSPQVAGRYLPQALGLVDAGAVSFDKGCYLGQEIVARAQHRGNVKKNLVRLFLPAGLQPQILADAHDAGRHKIGTLVQIAAKTALMVADAPFEDDTRCFIGETEVTADAG